eukprot:TRINITY_DN8382_c0_g1_i2.p1 TRINITY_DN8382_c0_g1~~TRINITY_DN8382_c0_g1_i2.p1  ORF type:complete len:410 (+),score=52.49 TRINITY_DN8382_c0_g1_i2:795-2024(+)
MTRSLFLFRFAAACCIFVPIVTSDYDVRQHLQTKSPYPSLQHPPYTPAPPGCEAIQLNAVLRHGCRWPSGSDTAKLSYLQTVLHLYGQSIPNQEFAWMSNWTNKYTPLQSGLLDVFGEWEHYNLSKRFVQDFPGLLNDTYSPLKYLFQTTQVSRAARSGNAFGFGFNEGRGPLGVSGYAPIYEYSDSAANDLSLRFFDNCPAFTNQVLNNSTYSMDSNIYYQNGIGATVARVAARLGLNATSPWLLGSADAAALYTACVFDVVVGNDETLFCSLFSPADFDFFETSADLQDYYIRGWGVPLSYQIAAPLLIDVFKTMDAILVAKPVSQVKAKFRFAHAETILPLLALLGLYNDPEPLHWNSPNLTSRLWRGSVLSPFAANVAFVLYNCSGSYRVKLMHNENEMYFPGTG